MQRILHTCLRRSFTTGGFSKISKPELVTDLDEIRKKAPQYADNSICVGVPGGASPFNISIPLNKNTKVASPGLGVQDHTENIGTIGRFDDINNIPASGPKLYSSPLNSNTITATGFGAGLFTINNMTFYNSMILLPGMAFAWKPTCWEEVNAQALAILTFMYPQPDIILFGCGLSTLSPSNDMHHFLKTMNCPYELMPTTSAIGAFNIVNEEYRRVAAFLITLDEDEYHDYELRKMIRSNK